MGRNNRYPFVQRRPIFKERRAVSDVVATLLLVAVVVSLGVVVFAFASSGLGGISQNFVNLMTGSGNKIAENVVVMQVTFTTSGSPQGADVFVRNVGTTVSSLASVYIVDQSTGAFITQVALTSQCLPGSSCAVNVGTFANIPHSALIFTPAHGHTYSFTVTSNLGNSVTFNAKAN